MQIDAYVAEKYCRRDTGGVTTSALLNKNTMLKKLFRRIFRKKVKIGKEERFETLFAEAVKVSPEWVKRQEKRLVEVARREDTVTDATIVIYRDRHGMTLACQFQRSGKKARTP